MTSVEGKGILIVEDDVRSAALVGAMLRITGIMNMRVCRSPGEVPGAVEQMSRIDLVLLDIQLPGEDGYSLFARLRKHPRLLQTPIVAVTAQVMPDDVARAESVGFDGFIGKPLNFDHFPGQIRRLLSGERVWEPR